MTLTSEHLLLAMKYDNLRIILNKKRWLLPELERLAAENITDEIV